MNNPSPVIAFELGVGEFRIVTREAVYQIKVCPDLVEATRGGEAPGETPAGEAPAGEGDPQAFFQELSQELFDKVGRLARQLSISVEELPAGMSPGALDSTGQQLESAKGQLEEIIDITEKASMSIMDSADDVQYHLAQLRDKMVLINNFAAAPPAAELPDADSPDPGSALGDKLAEVNALLDRLLQEAAAPAAAAAAEPAAPKPPAPAPAPAAPPAPAAGGTVTVVHFDVDVVFETLYELCTNEAVKDHVRQMRESRDQNFDSLDIAAKLTEMAATVTVEDGYYNFPINGVLKAIYWSTSSEEYRGILKKMNQTAASIFLDNTLPLEGKTVEIEAPGEVPAAAPPPAQGAPAPAAPPPPPAAPAPAGANPAVLDGLRALKALTSELAGLVRSGARVPAGGGRPAEAPDQGDFGQSVSEANELIKKIGLNMTKILETLSFQDLSGQRIKKVVALIGDIQTQLLSILVSVDTKIKVHQSHQDQPPEKTEKMAQDEVDRALEKLTDPGPSELMGPGAENRLNQNAVNDLLSQLGF